MPCVTWFINSRRLTTGLSGQLLTPKFGAVRKHLCFSMKLCSITTELKPPASQPADNPHYSTVPADTAAYSKSKLRIAPQLQCSCCFLTLSNSIILGPQHTPSMQQIAQQAAKAVRPPTQQGHRQQAQILVCSADLFGLQTKPEVHQARQRLCISRQSRQVQLHHHTEHHSCHQAQHGLQA